MSVRVEITNADACKRLLAEQPKRAATAISSATNRALLAGRTMLSKGIRSEYSVKAGTIKSHTRLKKASKGTQSGELRVSGRPIDLMEFSPSISRGGMVSVRIKKVRKKLPHSFFVAVGRAGIYHRTTRKRLPIEREFTLSVPQMAGNVNVSAAVQKRMSEVFVERLEHAMAYGRGQGYE